MDNWELAVIAAIAFAGGIVYAFFGWLNSDQPWVTRKFLRSVGAALIAGVAFGLGYSFTEAFSVKDVLTAFASGLGITAGLPKVIGAV